MSKSPSRRWKLWCVIAVVLSVGGVGVGFFRRGAGHDAEKGATARRARVGLKERLAAIAADNPGRVGDAALLQTAASRALFSFVTPGNADALNAALPAPSREIHYVQLNRVLIAGKQSPFWQKAGAGRFELPLPDGTAATVVIDRSEMLGPDRFTSVGRVEGRTGSRAVFAWNGGFLHALIEDPQRGNFSLRAATEDVSQFFQVDAALVPPCGGERRPPRAAAAGLNVDPPPPPTPPVAALENPQAAEVQVMMVYTQAVMPTLSGAARTAAIQSAFDLGIANTNAVLEASLITARVKLVRILETHYDEDASDAGKVQDDALTALSDPRDGQMDEIHAARDAAGADIVCLALGRIDFASIGLSYLIDDPNGLQNANFAFSVVQYSLIAVNNVVAHEFGHVFGCAHDRENARSGQGAYSFSYGYRFFGADGRKYHDIMAYDLAFPLDTPAKELSYFSNPDVIVPAPISVPIGIPAGRSGESNCALTIEKNAFATAAYRLQTQAPAGAGTLINVATRAFVGTGDQVLIGGFVVDGAQSKALLIRAAGPALTPFGVPDALTDPVLRVYAGSGVVAENDNWGSPSDPSRAAAGGEITAVTNVVRTFPFAAGSLDAAMIVTLPPGAYSAVVEGARGATGSGLIEAYEVQRDSSRIINVSTRGYASREQPMYGGFVVQGTPGTTKRILIRVLGPTLSRAPFSFRNALDDPEMELRNAAGELLIFNDDWSSGVEGDEAASPENDFKPRVGLYSEAKIFATGHAPANRREPCVMADLPPGAYTIVVRPFELRSMDGQSDEPEVPGVGVVEVFEIP